MHLHPTSLMPVICLHNTLHALGMGMGGECEATGENANSQSCHPPTPIQLLVVLDQALPSVTGQQPCAQQLAPSAVYLHVPCLIPVTDLHYSVHAWGRRYAATGKHADNQGQFLVSY